MAQADRAYAPIGGYYSVDPMRPLPAFGGGLPAYAATDRRSGQRDVIAIAVNRFAPARHHALQALTTPIEGVLTPLAHGSGPPVEEFDTTGRGGADGGDCYVIAPLPPGPPLSERTAAWTEWELIHLVLRPAARALEALQTKAITHRAIRPNNVFQASRQLPVVIGAAWAEPPALRQPSVFEPAYSAMCLPAGRGDGTNADDVYALGVLLVSLALGAVPLAGLDDTAILQRKLELGSYAAMVGETRLPAGIADLVRGMLAEDPDHRPPLASLVDPVAARNRRLATPPVPRAQRPLAVGATQVWNARMLAYALGCAPDTGLAALRSGQVVTWLRRSLGETLVASRIDDLIRGRGTAPGGDSVKEGAALLLRVVALIDPLAPLCWHGLLFWPDAIGPMLAVRPDADDETGSKIGALIEADELPVWIALRGERGDPLLTRLEWRRMRGVLKNRGPAFGLHRVSYLLNPLLPCLSPRLGRFCVTRPGDLLTALEANIGALAAETDLLDPHMIAYVAVRSEHRTDMEITEVNTAVSDSERALAQLRLLKALQTRFESQAVPGIAGWFVAHAKPLTRRWHNRKRREAVVAGLHAQANAGNLAAILSLVDDRNERNADEAGFRSAADAIARIDRDLHRIEVDTVGRAELAARMGQEIAAGAGLAALAVALLTAVLG